MDCLLCQSTNIIVVEKAILVSSLSDRDDAQEFMYTTGLALHVQLSVADDHFAIPAVLHGQA